MESSGYYKAHKGQLLYGACAQGQQIISGEYQLDRSDHTRTDDGWKWFKSEQEARDFYGDMIDPDDKYDFLI